MPEMHTGRLLRFHLLVDEPANRAAAARFRRAGSRLRTRAPIRSLILAARALLW